VQLILAVDESQGPANEEGIISCETLTLVMMEVNGAVKASPISMGAFRHLNDARGRSDDKDPVPSEWLMLGSDSGHDASILDIKTTTHAGKVALLLQMQVGYQEGYSMNVLTVQQNEEGTWEIVEYERGEVEIEERN
jgi:hypothetical protein